MPAFNTETNTWLGQGAIMWSTELDQAQFRDHKMVKFTKSKTWQYYYQENQVECATNFVWKLFNRKFHIFNNAMKILNKLELREIH